MNLFPNIEDFVFFLNSLLALDSQIWNEYFIIKKCIIYPVIYAFNMLGYKYNAEIRNQIKILYFNFFISIFLTVSDKIIEKLNKYYLLKGKLAILE